MDPAPSSIGLSSAFCAYCYIGMHLPSPPTPLRADSQHVFYASCISPWHSQSMRGVSAYSHSIANCSTRIGGLGGLGEVASACWGNSFPSGILNHLPLLLQTVFCGAFFVLGMLNHLIHVQQLVLQVV